MKRSKSFSKRKSSSTEDQKANKNKQNVKENTPVIEPAISDLGLARKGKADPLILPDLMGLDQVNLTMESGGFVLLGGQALSLGLLELGG